MVFTVVIGEIASREKFGVSCGAPAIGRRYEGSCTLMWRCRSLSSQKRGRRRLKVVDEKRDKRLLVCSGLCHKPSHQGGVHVPRGQRRVSFRPPSSSSSGTGDSIVHSGMQQSRDISMIFILGEFSTLTYRVVRLQGTVWAVNNARKVLKRS